MDKDRIELLLKLAEASWRDYSERRSIEWKVNFALWAALGGFSGFVFQQKTSIDSEYAIVASILLGCIFAVYMFFWKAEIQIRNRLDVEAAQQYWKEADKELGIPSPSVRTRPKGAGRWRRTHMSQVMITLLLALLAVLAIWTPKGSYSFECVASSHGAATALRRRRQGAMGETLIGSYLATGPINGIPHERANLIQAPKLGERPPEP